MDELAILFLHYGPRKAATMDHYQRLVRLHPRDLVIPIAYQMHRSAIPGTVDVAGFDSDYGWPIADPYSECDKIYYRWFLNANRPSARRYIFLEYDILPNCTAQSFYREVWHSDVAAADIVDIKIDTDWWPARWHGETHDGLWNFGMGLRPLAGIFWSHAALGRVAQTRRMPNAWCEFRAGTLANYLGFTLTVIPGAIRTLHWPPTVHRDTSAPTWFHPVKEMANGSQRIRQPLRRPIPISP